MTDAVGIAPAPSDPTAEPLNDPENTTGSAAEQPKEHAGPQGFRVTLTNFDGPFDLLLQLIGARRMDVTEVALHKVTDDFVAHIRKLGDDVDLGVITEFLVVAATLLDLKAARLLPNAEVENEDDLRLLEARDLLFARLLAYRAYQQVAALFVELEAGALRRYPRAVTLEQRYLGLLPEVKIGLDAPGFAMLASALFRPKPPPPEVSLDHIHSSPVSVAEHTAAIRSLLIDRGSATFTELVAECTSTLEVVARFLGLLNLYREAAVLFDQPEPLGTLTVTWSGLSEEATDAALDDQYD